MKKIFSSLALVIAAACIIQPKPPASPAPPAHHAVQVFVNDDVTGAWVDGSSVRTDAQDAANKWTSGVGPNGARADQFVSAGWNVCADAPNYLEMCLPVATFPATGDVVLHFKITYVPSKPIHFDPSSIPLETLAQIKGAMWTARLKLPFGPRPNQDDNILAMDFYQLYNATDRARMIQAYHGDRGYTHAVTGPNAGGDCYHGQYPCQTDPPNQAQWDAYLDGIQEWWDAGITPVYFAKPDNWSMGQMDQLDKLFSQPRAQKLLRVVVYTGWEPWKYEITNAEWVAWVQRGARVFPNALRLIHTVADVDAPTGGDDDKKLAGGNATAWRNVVPYLHGWLVQSCGYACSGNPTPTPEFLTNFANLFNLSMGSLRARFEQGYAGWPTNSAWSDGRPLKVYAGEFAAYIDYWSNAPEAQAVRLGDLAMAAGAAGSLDGMTVRK